MTLQVLLNILGMVTIISVLFYMQKKFVSFSKRVFTGLGLGIVFGLLLQFVYGSGSEVIKLSVDWFNIAGIRLYQIAANGCDATRIHIDPVSIHKSHSFSQHR